MVLSKVDKELKDFQNILDFGCGCGRAWAGIRVILPDSYSKLYGMDIDPEAIGWLKENYPLYTEDFVIGPYLPPSSFEAGMFDLIYGISVFTHLPEDMQFLWLEELARITKSGGYMIQTIRGKKHYDEMLDPVAKKIVDEKGFFYSDFGTNYGRSINLPDFYQTSFHSHDYIKREWGRWFEVMDTQAAILDGCQDVVLLRKKEAN